MFEVIFKLWWNDAAAKYREQFMTRTDGDFFESEANRKYTESAEPMHPLRLRLLFIKWAKTLRTLRDTESIREGLLEFMFYITPADRAAVLIENSISSRDRHKYSLWRPDTEGRSAKDPGRHRRL